MLIFLSILDPDVYYSDEDEDVTLVALDDE